MCNLIVKFLAFPSNIFDCAGFTILFAKYCNVLRQIFAFVVDMFSFFFIFFSAISLGASVCLVLGSLDGWFSLLVLLFLHMLAQKLLLLLLLLLLFVRVSFYLLAQNWVLVDFVANDFCWLPLRLHKL